MLSPEFFVSRVTFPIGATALVLVFGGLTLFLGKLIDDIWVKNQDQKEMQVIGGIFVFKNLFIPLLAVSWYLTQNTFPILFPGSSASLVGLAIIVSLYSAQVQLQQLVRYDLHRTGRFEEKFNDRMENALPERYKDDFMAVSQMAPLRFLQETIELSHRFLQMKPIFYLGSGAFSYFIVSTVLNGGLLSISASLVLGIYGIMLMAQSWAYSNSDNIWTLIEKENKEIIKGWKLSEDEKFIAIWNNSGKIRVNKDKISEIKQSRWKDEKLEEQDE
jgi:hypothetical protein